MKVVVAVPRIAEVVINVKTGSVRHSFSYLIPPELDGTGPGWRVVVPFGSRDMEGFVLEIREAAPGEDTLLLKQIREAPDGEAWFDDEMLSTARWLSDYYLCSLGEALRLFIPGKSGVRSEKFYQLINPPADGTTGNRILDFIASRGRVGFQRLRSEFGAACRGSLDAWVRDGLLSVSGQTRQRTTEKWLRVLKCAVPPPDIPGLLSAWKGRPAQRRLLERLSEVEFLPVSSDPDGVAFDAAAKALLASGLVREERIRVSRNSYCDVTGSCPPVRATRFQQAALDRINPAIRSRRHQVFLLHGATGSGKTEVYLQAAATALSEGRQVLVLIPEIAQTSQLLQRFAARFGPQVAVIHSRLNVSERRDVWDRFRRHEAKIVIGTRSALFLPGAGLGLIIVDEEHEFTYKQEESPRYHVRETALQRASALGATVVLGSATPSLETYHAAITGSIQLLSMPERVDGSALPSVEIVDMREELKQGRRSVISAALEKLLRETKESGGQSILLLNRRGHSTFVLCRECGFVMRCGHCSVPLVYHMQGGRLRCHYCDSSHAVPAVCPSCGSKCIRYFGAGTQRLEEELTALLPGVGLTRMDQDTTGGKGGHDKRLDPFRSGKSDILLGTQMVAKGHDIPNVTAVGILAADSALNMPDFRAAERTFALVMQAAGRAGRGSRPGRVVVQTYHPGHYALQAGAAQDYAAFYAREAEFRRQLQYPPFARFIKLTTVGSSESLVMTAAERMVVTLGEELERLNAGVDIMGPFAAPVAKIGDMFRVHTLLRGTDLSAVRHVLLQTGIAGARDVIVDVDPLGMM